MGQLARIMGELRKRALVDTLRDLSGAIEFDGPLDTEVTQWARVDDESGAITIVPVLDWVERPLIIVKPEFRATERAVATVLETCGSSGARFTYMLPGLPSRNGSMEEQ
jgi:hypothetical protein